MDFLKVVFKKIFLLGALTDIKNQCMNLNNGDKQNIQLRKGNY